MVSNLKKIFGFSFILLGTFLILRNNQDLNFIILLLILIIFISSLAIVFLPIINQKYINELPLINLINLYFLISYLGIFFFDKYEIFDVYKYNINEISNSIIVLFIGYLFFHLGYLIINYFLRDFKRKKLDYLTCQIDELLILGIFISVCVILFFYILKLHILLSALSQLKYPLLVIGIGLIFHYLIIKENLKKKYFFLLAILISIPIIFELISGSFNFPFMIIFIMYCYFVSLKKKINLFPFILISLMFLYIHLGKYDYRLKTWSEAGRNLTFLDTSRIFLSTYFFDKSKDLKLRNLIQRNDNFRLERRIFHSYWSLLIVTKETPKQIPYWNGYSYKILTSKLVPRIFWKDKPSDTLGNDFGHRYNVLTKKSKDTERDNNTSWNMPVLNEFYVNFGKIGVAFGMLLIGIFFGLITRIFSKIKKNNIEYMISFYLFVPLFFLESHLSLLFGALIQSYIFLMILSYVLLFILRKIR